MKYIKIFLASSIEEFEKQRKDLGDYIRSLNDIYVKRGIYFEFDICENLSNALSQTRKQDEYNEKIKNSEYFYLLFGKNVGEYTEEEFEVALEQFHQTGLPRIYTYFHEMADGQVPEKSVLDFMKRLDQQLGHYYVMFKDIDSVKLNILLELVRNEKMEKSVSVENGKVKVQDKEVLELGNIPIYSKNEILSQLREKKAVLDSRVMALRLKFSKEPENDSVLGELIQTSKERDAISEQLRHEENEMLRRYSEALKMGCDGVPMTERAIKARRLMECGDYQGALVILNDLDRQKEIEQSGKLHENLKLRMSGYIGENRLKILALHSLNIDHEMAKELEKCYQENMEIALEYQIEMSCLYDYANYLNYMHKFTQAMQVLDKLEKIYEGYMNVSDKEWVDLFILKAEVYGWLNELRLEERYLRKGAQLAENTEEQDTKSTIFTNYACVCIKRQKPEKAEIYLMKALELCENKEDREAAIIYGNLAHALRAQYIENDQEKLEKIKSFFNKAYEIEANLYQNDQTKDLARFAEVHLNLADFYFDLDDEKKAEGLYQKALEFSKEAAKINPEKNLKFVVQITRELAFYYDEKNAFDKSRPLYIEAMSMIERLRKQEPEAYGDIHATLCHNYGYLLAETGEMQESACYYQKAIVLYKELISKGNMVYTESLRSCEISLQNLSEKEK